MAGVFSQLENTTDSLPCHIIIIIIIVVVVVVIIIIVIVIIICPLTARVVGATQMISQPVSSIFLCSPLFSGTCRTSGLSIP